MKQSGIITILLFIFTLAVNGQRFEVDTLVQTGALEDRVNLVFLGDGYLEEDLDKFIQDVNWMLDEIFKKDPYPAYRNYFNVFAIKVPSEESGAANDPDSLINNYFGSTFNWANIWRLVVPARTARIQSVLRDNFPEYDQVIMLVNDSRYGGSGGWIATNTTHTSGAEICIHETGHSFAGLSDEYWAGSQYARENINMTMESDPDEVKWNRWISFKSTGVYPHEENTAWYRPHQNCEMRYLNRQFCPVCQEAHVQAILNLTSPLISYSPEQLDFVNTDPIIRFKIDLLEPIPNSLKTVWTLNADSVAGNIDSLLLSAESLMEGTNRVSVSILDTTHFIRDNQHSQAHMNIVTWNLDAGSSGIISTPSKNKLNVDLYPNPATDWIRIEYQLAGAGMVSMDLIGLDGKVYPIEKSAIQQPGNYAQQVQLNDLNLSSGQYTLVIRLDQDEIHLPLIKW